MIGWHIVFLGVSLSTLSFYLFFREMRMSKIFWCKKWKIPVILHPPGSSFRSLDVWCWHCWYHSLFRWFLKLYQISIFLDGSLINSDLLWLRCSFLISWGIFSHFCSIPALEVIKIWKVLRSSQANSFFWNQ